MTHIETSRVNEVLARQIGVIQEFAAKLDVKEDLQTLEEKLTVIDGALAALREALAAIPHPRG